LKKNLKWYFVSYFAPPFIAYFGAMIGLALFSKDSYFMLILQGYLYIIIINLLFTFLMPGISKTGHIGGLIGGYLFTFILYLVGLLK
jgi:rhomboid protease GluP